MKRRKRILWILALLMITFIFTGCAGMRGAELKVGDKVVTTHKDKNLSLLQPSVGPIELAESYRIVKQADTYADMMKNAQSGKFVAASEGKFMLGLLNNSSSQTVYMYHPEAPGLKLEVGPKGDFKPFEVRDIPYEIVLYNSINNKIIRQFKPRDEPDFENKIARKKLQGNVFVDFLIKINGTD